MAFLSNLMGFHTEYCLACLTYLIPLHKKQGWVLRALPVILVQLIFGSILIPFLQRIGGSLGFAFFFVFVAGVVLFSVCTECSYWDAVFGASCGYATQHFFYVFYSVSLLLFPSLQKAELIVRIAMMIAIYLCCYHLFGKRLPISGKYLVDWQDAVRSLFIVIPFAFFLSMVAESFYQSRGNLALYLICRIYAMFCCVFSLWVQTAINQKVSVEREYRTQKLLWQTQREQYKLSKENIEIINRKCHDLKYQVAALRNEHSEKERLESLDAIESSVMIYDSSASTGNEVLDTILTERSLTCEKENISWTCVADGSKLSHINPVDLYILFGNILDNALESVRKLDDPAQRVVSLNVYTRSNMAVIQVENYYAGTIQLEDGIPKTSKPDKENHGFGMKSIKNIVEKYGGSVSIDTADQIFLLSILLPLEN